MAKRTPTLKELLSSKKARDQLTLPQLYDLYEKVKEMAKGTGARSSIEDNPADLAHRLSKGRWKHADHLTLLSNALSRLERRSIRNLMISMPPRHGKSEMCSIWLPVWWLGRDPSARIIVAGYGQHFAREWGGKIRNKVLEHADELNVVLNKDQMAADAWYTTLGGHVLSFGVGGSIVGRGADLYIIDDPIKNAEEANSEVYRDKMWQWWHTSVITRREPGSCIVLIATRWHEDDLLGRVLANDEDKDWTVINIPAEAEHSDPLGRAEGEWLWPERWAKDGGAEFYVKTKKTLLPYWWSAQYQGRPTPPGGGILLREDWQWCRESDIPDSFDQVVQSWDLPLKDNRTSDYAAGQVWARRGVDLYLLDAIRDHLPPDQVIHHMQQFALKYRAVGKLIEDSAMGPTLIQTFQKKVAGMIPIPPKGSKMSRVLNAVPYLRGHNIHLPMADDGSKPKWVMDFVEECAQFDKGAYDDQVDAFTQAVTFLQPSLWSSVRAAEEQMEEAQQENVARDPDFLRKERARWFSEQVVASALKRAARRHNGKFGSRRMW